MWGNLALLVAKITIGGFLNPSNASALSIEGVPKILFLATNTPKTHFIRVCIAKKTCHFATVSCYLEHWDPNFYNNYYLPSDNLLYLLYHLAL